jgi:type I restriction enzyme S subunit
MKSDLIDDSEDHVTEAALDRLSVVPAESILVVVRSGILSRTLPVAQTKVPVTINQDMRAFVPHGGISAAYLAWQLRANEREILGTCSKDGTTVASIEGPALARFPLVVAPADEQTRIVAKLEELLSDLDAGVAELKAAQKKLQQYRQSLLKAAVEGALTTDWREAQRQHGTPTETGAQLLARILTERRARWEAKQLAKFKEQTKAPPKDWQKKYPEPVRPDTTDLPKLPADWIWASVDQCTVDENSITDGPFGSNLKSEHYQESGPRVIRLQNVGDGVFVDAYAHISEKHFSELSKHAVEEGDVVVAMLGEILPRACCIPSGVAPAIVKADCARVRITPELIQPELIVAQLSSKPIRDIAMKFVKGIGRPRINLGHVRAIPIALAPADEQVAIGTELQRTQLSIDEQLHAIDLSLRQSMAQRQNILRAAFRGKLVPQNPHDEPASVLLERVRAERAVSARQPRVRKTMKYAEA